MAIDDTTFDVPAGELVVLLGPSGCGKTTLLRAIAGLEQPNSGEITIADRLVYSSARNVNVPVNRRNVAVIFQGYALWPHMTVAENVAYPLYATRRGASKQSIRAKVSETLELVNLGDVGRSYPSTLSGGQQQRVSLARALAGDPAVILFDEPLSSVDAQIRRDLRREIQAMHERAHFTGIYVTHDQEEALALADRVAVLKDGRIVQYGRPAEVYDTPNSRYIAEFVGGANVVTGHIRHTTGGLVCQTLLGPFSIEGATEIPTDSDEVLAVVRPSDLLLTVQPEGTTEDSQYCTGTVTAVEFLGSRRDVLVRVTPSGKPIVVAQDRTDKAPSVGERVNVSAAHSRVRVVFE